MTALKEKFSSLFDELKSTVLEREEAFHLSILSILSGEHVLFLGPPGAAKSMLCREICKRISGANYFEKLLTQFTTPEEVFGPIDLVKYSDEGVYARNSKGSITQSHLSFIDEVFKANSAILNSLLTLINERLVHEVGSDPVKAPLLTLFGASNETPEDKSLRAFYDRFLVKLITGYVSEESNFEKLVTQNFDNEVKTTVTLDEIKEAQEEVKKVKMSKAAVEALKELKLQLGKDGIVVSDRKWVQASKFLRAVAWLDGKDLVDVSDLEFLVHVMWTEVKEIKAVERVVFKVANPLHLRAIEFEDKAREIYEKRPNNGEVNYRDKLENALQQITDIARTLKNEIEKSKTKRRRRADEALEQIAKWHNELSTDALKHIERLTLSL